MTPSYLSNPINNSELIGCTLIEKNGTPYHVAFAINQAYTRGMGISLFSLLKHHPEQSFHVHIFTTSISDQDKSRLKVLAKRYPVAISVHLFDETWMDDLPTIGRYSKSIYFRLIIPAVVKNHCDRVLYIDADTLVTGDLTDLLTLDFLGKTVGVCNDTKRARQIQCAALKLTSGNYFNSGLLMINIPQWNSHHITERVCDLLTREGPSFRFPDQDALNVLLENETYLLPKKYNYIYDIISHKVWHEIQLPEDTVMVHFTGKCKPWHNWAGGDISELYDYYNAQSPWSSQAYEQPGNYKEIKRLSRIHWYKGNYLQFLECSAKYIKMKFFK
ncbi:TPA: sugar glycosyltransferase [Serratia fonticola]|nr:sugar glycosyltransferase [Serratia fonticola]